MHALLAFVQQNQDLTPQQGAAIVAGLVTIMLIGLAIGVAKEHRWRRRELPLTSSMSPTCKRIPSAVGSKPRRDGDAFAERWTSTLEN